MPREGLAFVLEGEDAEQAMHTEAHTHTTMHVNLPECRVSGVIGYLYLFCQPGARFRLAVSFVQFSVGALQLAECRGSAQLGVVLRSRRVPPNYTSYSTYAARTLGARARAVG